MLVSDKLSTLQLLLITICSIFAQDLDSNKPANSTLSQSTTLKPDTNITWIKISPITSNTTTETPFENTSTNCTISENISNESQNLDISSSLRRKRRKRRRNKYKSWNQRTPEHSYKKHSTRVQLNKPVQFLVPPDYQENLIPKESTYYKSRNDAVEKFSSQSGKKIPPPVRHLLPPLVDTRFLNLIDPVPPTPAPVPVQKDVKKSKQIDWSPNSTNRGSTKFKHTIYYSDSGNEIISNYEITSTTPTSRVKYTTTSNDERAFIPSRAPNEIPKNSNKLEHRPIVVQSTPIQYTTSIPIHNHSIAYPSRDTRINSLVSFEVANAGMQVINMTSYQLRNQFVPNDGYKPLESQSISRPAQSQRTPLQQPTPQPINYQQYQPVQDIAHQANYQQLPQQGRIPQQVNNQQLQPQQSNQVQSSGRASQQINYQQAQSQQQNYQQSQPQDRISQQVNYQQAQSQQQNYQQSQSQDRIPQQVNYQQVKSQQPYQQPQSLDRIPQQLNYQQTQSQQQNQYSESPINSQQSPSSDQTLQQINYQQSLQHQHQKNQNHQSNLLQSQPQQTPRQPDYSRYQPTQSSSPNTGSHSQNFQQPELPQPYQTYNQQSLQNYQQTTFSRAPEPRATTPTPRLISNRTVSQTDKTENFKGLDLAESKYFSDIPSEQEFNAVQNGNHLVLFSRCWFD